MTTMFAVLSGIVSLLAAAFPLYKAWKRWRDTPDEIYIAADNPKRVDFFKRMRERLPSGKQSDERAEQ